MIPIRKIEMGVGEGESHGQWWTEWVDIPRDTDERDLELIALKTYRDKYRDDTLVIGLLDVYWIPELGDTVNPRYYRTKRDIYASELAMLPTAADDHTPDFVMIPAGAIVQEGPDGVEGDMVDIIYDHPEYLLVGNCGGFVAAVDLEELT